MADPPAFESPIVRVYNPVVTNSDLQLSDESAETKLLVRADDDTTAAEQLGVRFGSSRSEGDVLICGQRPTEWLLVGQAEQVDTIVAGLDRAGHVSLIDHTHARALFRLTGRDSEPTLAKVCNLDLSDSMTPDGAVVPASVAEVGCDIIRQDLGAVRSYRLACDRSFAQYLFDALLDAGDEFGIAPEG